jgi:ArsR family transcriptional regulator
MKINEAKKNDKLIDKDEDILRASMSIKAIAHPLRLKILCALAENELTVWSIVDCTGSSQSNISQHLGILRNQGILVSRKDANRVLYRIGDPRTIKLVSMMRDVFCASA